MRMPIMRVLLLLTLMLGGIALGQESWNDLPEPDAPTVIRSGLPVTNGMDQEVQLAYCQDLLRKHSLIGIVAIPISEKSSLTGNHISFGLEWKGIRLAGYFINIHQSTSGEWLSVVYSLPEAEMLPSQQLPLLSAQAIQTSWQKRMAAYESRIETVWIEHDESLVPAFHVTTFSHQEKPSWDIYVDARTGEELFRKDRAVYLHKEEEDTTGMGRIFFPNPCTAANVDYGDLFVDSMDKHQAIFETLMDTVTLNEITWDEDSGVFRLLGPYIELQSISAGSPAPATSVDGNFFYRRDSSSFEDVMVYYHIDRFQRYVQSLGFQTLQNSPIAADAHGFTSDVSAFVPNMGNSYLLFGTGNVDDAEDADVIIHEYIHALSYAAAPETNSGRERRGLDEGMADYFTAGYSYDITPNKWQMLFNWDGHNEYWSGRVANSAEAYPPANSLSIYAYGEIWSSALMKMRLELGGPVMDKIALESLYGFFPGMTVFQAGRYVLSTDSLLFNYQHRETIRKYLCSHKIDVDPLVPCLVVNISELEDALSFQLAPNPSNGHVRLSWNPELGKRYKLELVNLLGERVFVQENITTNQLDLSLNLPDASYLLRFSDSEGRFLTKRLVLYR